MAQRILDPRHRPLLSPLGSSYSPVPSAEVGVLELEALRTIDLLAPPDIFDELSATQFELDRSSDEHRLGPMPEASDDPARVNASLARVLGVVSEDSGPMAQMARVLDEVYRLRIEIASRAVRW